MRNEIEDMKSKPIYNANVYIFKQTKQIGLFKKEVNIF